jgi:PAS domain S-box-containing protein
MPTTDNFLNSLSVDGRYRLLIEAVTDYAIYMLDSTGIVTSWTPGAERFKGYKADEIIGKHFSLFYSDEDRASGLPARALATAASQGKFESEGWRVRKDGTRFWAYVVVDPIRHANGDVIGFAKITRDLTQRRLADEKLRQTQEQFRLLVQNVTDYALYLLDTSGHVSNWNLGAERIKGYLPHEIIGKHFSQFYTPEDREAGEPQKALETALRDGRFEKEGWRVRKGGKRFWAHVVIDPVRDSDGKLIGFAKITRDITERKESQAELEKTREALFQSQKMDAIGQLTGGIAHDFNNLLMVIQGSLELVKKRLPDDPKLHSLIDNAVLGARRGSTLTKRMLAFARRQELKAERVSVADLVRSMTDLLQSALGATISIETRFPLSLRPVLADDNQLEMAVLNLVVNARDAMPNGGNIIIAAREETITGGREGSMGPGTYVCLSVADSGVGMDAVTLRRAVEPFYTTKGVGKGTGLGLSMVHGVAEQSGGRLLLKSELNKGTVAEMWLPVADTAAHGAVPLKISTAKPSTRRRLVVLAVDDDSLVLTNTVAMLDDLGHTVIPASSAADALEILRRGNAVDVVITDQVMPHITGQQLAQRISAEWPALPVILATGFAELDTEPSPDLQRLTKPFSQDELIAKISEAVVPRSGVERVVPLRSR